MTKLEGAYEVHPLKDKSVGLKTKVKPDLFGKLKNLPRHTGVPEAYMASEL